MTKATIKLMYGALLKAHNALLRHKHNVLDEQALNDVTEAMDAYKAEIQTSNITDRRITINGQQIEYWIANNQKLTNEERNVIKEEIEVGRTTGAIMSKDIEGTEVTGCWAVIEA